MTPTVLVGAATLLVHASNNLTNWGEVALTIPGPGRVVMQSSTFVYDPRLIAGFDGTSMTTPAWSTPVPSSESSTVASARFAAPAAAVDSILLYNVGNIGGGGNNCNVSGYHSIVGPQAAVWTASLEAADCGLVDMPSPFRYAAISDDAAVVAAVTADLASATITVVCFDGQTGVVRWRRVLAPPGPPDGDEVWENHGVAVSGDGRWVLFDAGWYNAVGPAPLYVLDAATGAPRGDSALSMLVSVPLQAQVSPNGDYVACGAWWQGPGQLFAWNESRGTYVAAGAILPPLPPTAGTDWELVDVSLSHDAASGRSFLGAAWYENDLSGPSLAALWDASAVAGPPLAVAHTAEQTQWAIADASIDCLGPRCAWGFWSQGSPSQATVGLLDAASGAPVFAAATSGSVQGVALAPGPAASVFLAAGACSTQSVCTGPGGDVYLWRVDV